MVFSFQDYPYTSKSGIRTELNKRSDYERHFLDAMKSGTSQVQKKGHQIFICNIFSNDYLNEWKQQKEIDHKQLDLDKCFIISDMSFTSSQYQHICPSINEKAFDLLDQINLQNYVRFVIQYCGYLGIKCIALPFLPTKEDILLTILNKLEEQLFKAKLGVILTTRLQQQISWEKYIQFRKNLDSKIHIDLLVQFTPNLPAKNIIAKWIAQKITFFSFSKDCYIMNNTGNAVLTLPFENLTKNLFKLKSGFIFSICTKQAESLEFKPFNYFRYINHLFQIMAKNSTKREISARGLYEVLQHPLQPYADNLESETYSIFQFDTPKYDEYAVSILLAFQKLNITNRNIVAYYLGSGRGALIPGIVSASRATKKKVTIYAIQKNPFPLQSLKRRIKENKWSNIVKIVKTDIKSMKFEEKPDIFFSELLGGFGDNELSPQCLKWAEDKIVDKQSLICIPQKYSSFIKPVSYPWIHRSLSKSQKQSYFTVNFGWHCSPFKSEKVWQFCHPLPEKNDQQLSRKSVTEFVAPENITIHGILGSFDCNLYDSSYFSIVPETQTIDMYSWFPIYFSFFEEQYLEKDQCIQISMVRINTVNKIWYEWSYRIFDNQKKVVKQSKIHNKDGCQKCIYL